MAEITVLAELFVILIAHAVSGIYSSNLKYSKKTTFIIWGIWLALQGCIWCFRYRLRLHHSLTDSMLKGILWPDR